VVPPELLVLVLVLLERPVVPDDELEVELEELDDEVLVVTLPLLHEVGGATQWLSEVSHQ
jgi:hypothetical protein